MISQWVWLFATAFVLSLGLTPLSMRLAVSLGAIDHPDGRRVHVTPVPRLGGMAIALALLVALLVFMPMDRVLMAFILGAFVAWGTGLVDDLNDISPWLKLMGEIAAAWLFLGLSGASLENFGDFLGIGDIRFGPWALIVNIFCMVGLMNAINLIDGMDGLAGGLAVVASLFLGLLALWEGHALALAIDLALLASVLGFLPHNMHPARVFMGDSGSLLLGFGLSALCPLLAQGGSSGMVAAPITIAMIMALPILDTLAVMARRLWRGKSPFRPDRSHLHHRLLALGFGQRAALPILLLAAVSFGLLALVGRHWPEWQQFYLALALGIGMFSLLAVVQRRLLRMRRKRA